MSDFIFPCDISKMEDGSFTHLPESHFCVVGDVHGKGDLYKKVVEKSNYSLQVGDMGFDYDFLSDIDCNHHVFFGGNHDNYFSSAEFVQLKSSPIFSKEHHWHDHRYPFLPPHHLGDWGTWEIPESSPSHNGHVVDMPNKLFYTRGAWSIDQDYRQLGYDWFPEEELNHSEMENAVQDFVIQRPFFMASHSAPLSVVEYFSAARMLPSGRVIKTRTNQGLEAMLWSHRPKLWVFGHYHKDFMSKLNFLLEDGKVTNFSWNIDQILDCAKNKYDLNDTDLKLLACSDDLRSTQCNDGGSLNIQGVPVSLKIESTLFVCLDELSSLHFDENMNLLSK